MTNVKRLRKNDNFYNYREFEINVKLIYAIVCDLN